MPLRDELNGFLKLPGAFFGIRPPGSGLPDVGVLGIPYDMTSSYYPGCRFGPDAIRRATTHERSHSEPLKLGSTAHAERPLLSQSITLEDIGDLEVELRQPEQAMYDISDAAALLSPQESYLLFLGGDHFVTYPLLKGVRRGRPGKYGLVWLDAHADYYDDYGGYELSHATGLRRIIGSGLVEQKNVVSYDMRSALSEHLAELGPDSVFRDSASFKEAFDEMASRVESIYITVDLDVLRPELVPGVGHPESGGPDVATLTELLRTCFASGSVRYVDLVELNPMLDTTGVASVTARDVVKELLTGFAVQKGYK